MLVSICAEDTKRGQANALIGPWLLTQNKLMWRWRFVIQDEINCPHPKSCNRELGQVIEDGELKPVGKSALAADILAFAVQILDTDFESFQWRPDDVRREIGQVVDVRRRLAGRVLKVALRKCKVRGKFAIPIVRGTNHPAEIAKQRFTVSADRGSIGQTTKKTGNAVAVIDLPVDLVIRTKILNL